MKWESPRGPISIDPATRDIVQNVYIRRVEKVGKDSSMSSSGSPNVKDPRRTHKIGRRLATPSTRLHDGAIAFWSPHNLFRAVNSFISVHSPLPTKAASLWRSGNGNPQKLGYEILSYSRFPLLERTDNARQPALDVLPPVFGVLFDGGPVRMLLFVLCGRPYG